MQVGHMKVGPFVASRGRDYGFACVDLPRGRYLYAGKSVMRGWRVRLQKHWDYSSKTNERCRDCDTRLLLRGWDSMVYEWLYCPKCSSRLRRTPQLVETAEAHAAELGMTLDEYSAHCKSLVSKPTEAEMDEIKRRIDSDPKFAKRLGVGS